MLLGWMWICQHVVDCHAIEEPCCIYWILDLSMLCRQMHATCSRPSASWRIRNATVLLARVRHLRRSSVDRAEGDALNVLTTSSLLAGTHIRFRPNYSGWRSRTDTYRSKKLFGSDICTKMHINTCCLAVDWAAQSCSVLGVTA